MNYAGFDVRSRKQNRRMKQTILGPRAPSVLGGGFNRPVTFTALTQACKSKPGITAQMQQKNLNGDRDEREFPNRILISPFYRFDLAVLLNSSYVSIWCGSCRAVGGAFAINHFKVWLTRQCHVSCLTKMVRSRTIQKHGSWLIQLTVFQMLTKVPVGV